MSNTTVIPLRQPDAIDDPLTEVLRAGARELLAKAERPVFYTGGDTVVREFLFLGMFAQWGQAYSIDSWRRRRKAILGGAEQIPPLQISVARYH